jgi:solute:Na+ symporter, SSS family
MLWVYYQKFPLAIPLPESRPGIQANDYIYPIFMLTAVPNLLKGFLIVAILAAAMSSVSSALTSLASVATMDFVKELGTKVRSEAFYLRFSRISTIGWAALLMVVAMLTKHVESALNVAFALRGLTSGALLGGLLLAVFWKKGRAVPVMAGMAMSLGVMIILNTAAKDLIFWPWYTLIGTAVTVATALAVSACIPTPAVPLAALDRPGHPPGCVTKEQPP